MARHDSSFVVERRSESVALEVGTNVLYGGVINEEADLERRGNVADGPNMNGEFLIEWVVPDGVERRWESPSFLQPIAQRSRDILKRDREERPPAIQSNR